MHDDCLALAAVETDQCFADDADGPGTGGATAHHQREQLATVSHPTRSPTRAETVVARTCPGLEAAPCAAGGTAGPRPGLCERQSRPAVCTSARRHAHRIVPRRTGPPAPARRASRPARF